MTVLEKLEVSDGMGSWIDDFKKSDAPQFQGKTDKERREMAMAAYLSAKTEAMTPVKTKGLNKDKSRPAYIGKMVKGPGYPHNTSATQGKRMGGGSSGKSTMYGESVELDEALKTTHVVIDTADGNRIVSSATNEKQAKSSIVSAERPPMNIKDKKTLKVVQLKKPVSLNKDILGTVFKESVELDELTAAEKKLVNQMYDKKGNLTPMGKKVMNHDKKLGDKGYVESTNFDEETISENYRVLAKHGMGAETKNSIKVGTEVDYYQKDGAKYMGKITKMTPKGYIVRDDKTKKEHEFTYHDRNAAKKLLKMSEETVYVRKYNIKDGKLIEANVKPVIKNKKTLRDIRKQKIILTPSIKKDIDLMNLNQSEGKKGEAHHFTDLKTAQKKAREIGGKLLTGKGKSLGQFLVKKD